MRRQMDTATSDALKRHQEHTAVVIGRLLAGHARKQATPSARLDPTLGKIEVRFCHQGRNHVFKIGGPIPWSRLLYRTEYGWYTQFRALQSVM